MLNGYKRIFVILLETYLSLKWLKFDFPPITNYLFFGCEAFDCNSKEIWVFLVPNST